MKVGIIGGTGAMGGFFAEVFRRAGHQVRSSGRSTASENRGIAETSDLVMVSVPIRSTVAVIREIAPLLAEDQILCDLTSIKAEPVAAMLESRAEVVGLHPMFGPSAGSLAGQTIVVTPARCRDETLALFTGIFAGEGAVVTLTTPERHDAMMAIVQGLTHFATLALAETVRRTGMDATEMLAFMSPVYRIELGLVGRILGQDPGLYADILEMNPAVPGVLDEFLRSAADLREIVASGDPEGFEGFFKTNAEWFGGYLPRASQETDAMIRALVNR
jgi:prephenate dehydrogenase